VALVSSLFMQSNLPNTASNRFVKKMFLAAGAIFLTTIGAGIAQSQSDHYPARKITFPTRSSFGDLYLVRKSDSCNDWAKRIHGKAPAQARGVVAVPADSPVCLKILYDGGLDVAPLANLKADDIQSLDMSRVEMHKDTGKYVSLLTGLKELSASDTEAGDDFAHYIVPLQNLECLDLNRTQITDKGLEDIAKLKNLKILSLTSDRLTDKGIANLAKLKSLKSLHLEKSELTDAGLKPLLSLQNLKCLNVNETKITDAGLESIAKLRALTNLQIPGTGVRGPGLKYLGQLTHLGGLRISDKTIAPYCVTTLKRLLPHCEIVVDQPRDHKQELLPDFKD
jgi:hypothetical protein